jgi:hypothetical protein
VHLLCRFRTLSTFPLVAWRFLIASGVVSRIVSRQCALRLSLSDDHSDQRLLIIILSLWKYVDVSILVNKNVHKIVPYCSHSFFYGCCKNFLQFQYSEGCHDFLQDFDLNFCLTALSCDSDYTWGSRLGIGFTGHWFILFTNNYTVYKHSPSLRNLLYHSRLVTGSY